jgi:uncharacterized membrane protein
MSPVVRDEDTALVSKWAQFRTLPEFKTMLIGLTAVGALIFYYVYTLLMNGAAKANHVWKMVATHIMGGAAFGVTTGAAFEDMALWENVIFNTLLTSGIIFLSNTLLNLSARKLVKFSMLDRQLNELQDSAAGQKKKWVKLGIPGIFIFVMLPMTGTGPIIGSILGRMIGLSYWTNLLTVTCGSIATILVFAVAADWIAKLVGERTLNLIILSVVALMVVIFVVARLLSWFKQRKKSVKS